MRNFLKIAQEKQACRLKMGANYYYHGPLARVELGDLQVQGQDYVYTLQGWIKGVNSNTLFEGNDPGKDGDTNTLNNPNRYFARDVYGYSLNFFDGDYSPIDNSVSGANHFLADLSGSDVLANRYDLFNGNISSMVTTITNPTTREILPLGNAYKYDQLNRIKQSVSYNNLELDTANVNFNKFGSGGTQMYFNNFSYDANGNMMSAVAKDNAGNYLDFQTYNYQTISGNKINNRLYAIQDTAVDDSKYGLSDQLNFDNTPSTINTVNNYRYDAIGNLIYNAQDSIINVEWTVFNKPKAIYRMAGCSKKNVKFDYDALHNRIAKHIYTSDSMWLYSEYYVKDGRGNIMTTYKHFYDDEEEEMNFHATEQHIYGSSSLGIRKDTLEMIGATVDTVNFVRVLGKKHYSLNNHLSNTNVVITDKKIPVESISNPGEVEYFVVEILSAQGYAPFGGDLKGMDFNSSDHPNSFNGKRDDEELGDWQDYGMRMYMKNARRFNSVDPLAIKFAELSTYQFASNSPIGAIDLDGLEAFFVHGTGTGTWVWDVYKDANDNPLLRDAVRKSFGNMPLKDKGKELFEWSKENNSAARKDAVDALVKQISENRVEGEPITVVGHSHGGNIALEAVEILRVQYPDTKINLVTLNTPVRDDYQLSEAAKNDPNVSHFNYYIGNDKVQAQGGYDQTGQVWDRGVGVATNPSKGNPPQGYFGREMAYFALAAIQPLLMTASGTEAFFTAFKNAGGERGDAGRSFEGATNVEIASPVRIPFITNIKQRHNMWMSVNAQKFIDNLPKQESETEEP